MHIASVFVFIFFAWSLKNYTLKQRLFQYNLLKLFTLFAFVNYRFQHPLIIGEKTPLFNKWTFNRKHLRLVHVYAQGKGKGQTNTATVRLERIYLIAAAAAHASRKRTISLGRLVCDPDFALPCRNSRHVVAIAAKAGRYIINDINGRAGYFVAVSISF